ncbi:MAG TPA: SDR family NAD(P)-dependent oxidoreductase, partial [Dehalococcoidia bacterium]|nr:SDR family NAD(P)-dependent oxidoreductase [Dehalococcoidia bacterium]
MLPEFDLTGRTVLVTGAGRGIGKGIARVLAEAGCDVAVNGFSEGNAARVAAEVQALGRRGISIAADATKLSEMERVAERVLNEFGHLDILINCCGDSIRGTVAALPDARGHVMTEADWHSIIDINLTQAFTGCQAFGRHLLQRRSGSVINISSFAALRPRANIVAYAAAKAGLTRFTESLALEWAPYDVRVNAIAPGQFPDADTMTAEQLQQRDEQAKGTIPLRRVGRLREVGLLASYLASDAAAYVTGQT